MKIYTRRGDAGETDLFGAGRVAKDDLRVAAYGDVDELNAHVGVAATASNHGDVQALLQGIQDSLFSVGSVLAAPDPGKWEQAGIAPPTDADVAVLEQAIDAFEAELEPLKSFILPGGTAAASAFHVARTVCRRAERSLVSLQRQEALEPTLLGYLNRLSDLLFTLARLENRRSGVRDVEWNGGRRG